MLTFCSSGFCSTVQLGAPSRWGKGGSSRSWNPVEVLRLLRDLLGGDSGGLESLVFSFYFCLVVAVDLYVWFSGSAQRISTSFSASCLAAHSFLMCVVGYIWVAAVAGSHTRKSDPESLPLP